MRKEEEIRQLLYRFVSSGLVDKNLDALLSCFSTRILGIGLGEQGFVTSLEDVRNVFESGLKDDNSVKHTLEYKRIEIMRLNEEVGIVCADVQVNAHPENEEGKIIKTAYQQSLTVIYEDGEWKICGLHASVPVITEEYIEAYPLKIAENTLRSLRAKIGEEVYLAEEQFRKAVLSDAIAFYIINFTADCFEKCQVQNDICVTMEPGTPYDAFLIELTPQYVYEEDRARFLKSLSIKNIEEAYCNGTDEVSCEYRMKSPQGDYIWTKTILRLIIDAVSGDKKGIMYVKNIDEEKRAATQIKEKAEYDSMTKALNKGTVIQKLNALMKKNNCDSIFLMIDVDDFKLVNDTFGHPVGDKVLVSIAQLLKDSFDSSALIGRLGGDEFCVFLHNTSLDEMKKLQISKLLEKVRQIKVCDAMQFQVSVSIGAVCLNSGQFEAFYQAADSALYQAKRAGKNKIVFI